MSYSPLEKKVNLKQDKTDENLKTKDKTITGAINENTTSLAEIIQQKGVVNGIASLDGTGKVPTEQLPSYVPASEKGKPNGVAELDEKGELYPKVINTCDLLFSSLKPETLLTSIIVSNIDFSKYSAIEVSFNARGSSSYPGRLIINGVNVYSQTVSNETNYIVNLLAYKTGEVLVEIITGSSIYGYKKQSKSVSFTGIGTIEMESSRYGGAVFKVVGYY